MPESVEKTVRAKMANPMIDLDEYKERLSPRTLVSLLRSQLAAFGATAVDFGMVILLTEVFGLWYVASNAIGAFCGAVVSFSLGRIWVFDSRQSKISHQAIRYFLVAAGSLLLNTFGVYLITEYFTNNYILSKVLVSLVVGLCWNFTLHKYFVFRK